MSPVLIVPSPQTRGNAAARIALKSCRYFADSALVTSAFLFSMSILATMPLSSTRPCCPPRGGFAVASHEEGEASARAALAEASAEGDVDGQREALWLISSHADRRGRLVVAAGAGEQALALLADGAIQDHARLHCHLARIYDALDLDASNLRHATAAYDIAQRCDDVPLLCLTLSRLAWRVRRPATGAPAPC